MYVYVAPHQEKLLRGVPQLRVTRLKRNRMVFAIIGDYIHYSTIIRLYNLYCLYRHSGCNSNMKSWSKSPCIFICVFAYAIYLSVCLRVSLPPCLGIDWLHVIHLLVLFLWPCLCFTTLSLVPRASWTILQSQLSLNSIRVAWTWWLLCSRSMVASWGLSQSPADYCSSARVHRTCWMQGSSLAFIMFRRYVFITNML